MKKKILSTLLVAAMTISMLAGCGGNNAGYAGNAGNAGSTGSDTTATADSGEVTEFTYFMAHTFYYKKKMRKRVI